VTTLPVPAPGEESDFVARHLRGLFSGEVTRSARFRGGQVAADTALASFDVRGYAARRSEVWPPSRRGASGLSPWIRHGLITLPRAWAHVEGGPARDVERFRDELLWQEYARHVYARIGAGIGRDLRAAQALGGGASEPGHALDRRMACIDLVLGELDRDGWMVNQSRMWIASQLSVRHGLPWQRGELWMRRRLLDGSRAANALGWQWTAGTATGRPYGFSRQQVERRAPGTCSGCPLSRACPIGDWPPDGAVDRLAPSPLLARDPDHEATAGPLGPEGGGDVDAVWITAESLGDGDPALVAHPDAPAMFVFDEGYLDRFRPMATRLVFITECLADLATRRPVEVHRGDPVAVLAGRRVAATYTPVPGWRARAAAIAPTAVHPWPWLRRPGSGSVASFSAWRGVRREARRGTRRPRG
jgi:deoxyribodipyrimidine photo-lyase